MCTQSKLITAHKLHTYIVTQNYNIRIASCLFFIVPLNLTTNVKENSIAVTWESAESRYCGNVLYYVCNLFHNNTVTESNHTIYLNHTFENLSAGTTYNISVAAVNRVGMGEAALVNVTTCKLRAILVS